MHVISPVYAMGNEVGDIMGGFGPTGEEKQAYTAVQNMFAGHVVVRRNGMSERWNLNSRCQEDGKEAKQ